MVRIQKHCTPEVADALDRLHKEMKKPTLTRPLSGGGVRHDETETAIIQALSPLQNTQDFEEVISKTNDYKQTLAHFAVQFGYTDLLRRLVGWNIDLSIADVNGFTALHCAYKKGDKACIDVLLEKGAPETTLDALGRAPSHLMPEAFALLNDHDSNTASNDQLEMEQEHDTPSLFQGTPLSPTPLAQRHTISGPPSPRIRWPLPPSLLLAHAGSPPSLQCGQEPSVTPDLGSPATYSPSEAIQAVPADLPRAPPVAPILHNPQSPPPIYYDQNEYTAMSCPTPSPPSPSPPPTPPSHSPLPLHFQRASSPPAPDGSSRITPTSSPRPLNLSYFMGDLSAVSQSTAVPSPDIQQPDVGNFEQIFKNNLETQQLLESFACGEFDSAAQANCVPGAQNKEHLTFTQPRELPSFMNHPDSSINPRLRSASVSTISKGRPITRPQTMVEQVLDLARVQLQLPAHVDAMQGPISGGISFTPQHSDVSLFERLCRLYRYLDVSEDTPHSPSALSNLSRTSSMSSIHRRPRSRSRSDMLYPEPSSSVHPMSEKNRRYIGRDESPGQQLYIDERFLETVLGDNPSLRVLLGNILDSSWRKEHVVEPNYGANNDDVSQGLDLPIEPGSSVLLAFILRTGDDHTCVLCKESLSTRVPRQLRHVRGHIDLRPFPCEGCDSCDPMYVYCCHPLFDQRSYVPIGTLQGSVLVTFFNIIIDRQNRVNVPTGELYL